MAVQRCGGGRDDQGRLIYFSVVSRAALEKEGFNYHIELAQVATSQPVKLLGVVLDPDITNTNLIPPIPPS